MGVTNRASIAIGLEESVGVLPVSPEAIKYPLRSEDFVNPLTFDESGEFRDDRLTTAYDLTAEDASGGFDVNMRCEVFDTLIAASFYGDWADLPSRDNFAASSQVTGVTGSSGTVAVASGDAFVTGTLCRLDGFAGAANNAVKVATGGSATTAVFGAGAGLVDEASPGAYARVVTVGFAGASGDITATLSGLGSTALDFTTIPGLLPGTWIKIGGSASGTRFDASQLNTWARISGTVTANAIPLDNLPASWTTDAGTGKTIWVFVSELVTPGDGATKRTFFLDKKIPVTGGFRYLRLRGLHPQLTQINTEARGRMTARFSYLGIGGSFGDTPAVVSPKAPRTRRPLVSGRSFVRLHEGGGAFATTLSVPSINFILENQLVPVLAAHLLGYEDVEPAEATARIEGNLNFRTDALYTKFRGQTETSMSAVLLQDNEAYVIESPTGYLTTADIPLPGPNQIINMPFTFTTHANDGAVNRNKQYGFHRFRYVEA